MGSPDENGIKEELELALEGIARALRYVPTPKWREFLRIEEVFPFKDLQEYAQNLAKAGIAGAIVESFAVGFVTGYLAAIQLIAPPEDGSRADDHARTAYAFAFTIAKKAEEYISWQEYLRRQKQEGQK